MSSGGSFNSAGCLASGGSTPDTTFFSSVLDVRRCVNHLSCTGSGERVLSFGSCVSHDSRYLISWLNRRMACSYGIPCILTTGGQNTRTGIWRPCGATTTCRCRQVAFGETVPLCWQTLTFVASSLTSPGVVPFVYPLPNSFSMALQL